VQSSPPVLPSSQQRPKRARADSVSASTPLADAASSPAGPSGLRSSPPPSSLPPSSPPQPFSDFGDDVDVGDDEEQEMRARGRARDQGDDDDDEDGEDLFADNMAE
jgi:DNA replication licensing factor MCM2